MDEQDRQDLELRVMINGVTDHRQAIQRPLEPHVL